MGMLIEFGGEEYVFDLNTYNKLITIDSGNSGMLSEIEKVKVTEGEEVKSITETTREYDGGHIINTPIYDLLRMCLEVVLTYNEDVDTTLGLSRALNGVTLPFKFAFNTLVEYKILKTK